MDMLSLCRKRNMTNSPEPARRSPRIVGKQTKWGRCSDNNDQHSLQHNSTTNTDLPAISETEDGNILLRVFVKPGAKRNAVMDMGENFVSIQIAAPARDSQANIELVEYLGLLLHLEKSYISIDIGLRSKIKTVKITKDGFTIENLQELLSQEITN